MSVSVTNKLNTGSGVDATSYATASMTFLANTLYLVGLVTRTGITADPNVPTATGTGLTLTQVGTVVFDNTSSSRRRLTLFRALPSSGTTTAITFDCGGQTQTSADWICDEITGIDTTGTNGANAIVQAVTNFDGGGSSTSLTVTLAAFGSASNGAYGIFGNGNPAGGGFTAGSGFTLSGNNTGDAEAGSQITSEWRSTNSTTVGLTSSVGGEIGGIAVELKAAGGGAVVVNPGFFLL